MVIGVVALVVIAVFFFWKQDKNGPKFRTEKVIKGNITDSVTATGTVNAVTTVLVGTQVSGTVNKILADFNSRVKNGQLIAEIDPSTFIAQVDQAKANVLNAQANYVKAEASLADAKRTLVRNKELFAKGYVPRSDLDTAETNVETSAAQSGSMKASIEQAVAALSMAETNLRYTKIVSPVDGTVISRNVDVGQTVAASFQTPTLFTIAQDLTKMQIDANVDESDIGRIKLGQDVDFMVDAYPEVTFKGKVSQVRSAPITVQNVVTYDVVVKVDNPDLKLLPGMTANVTLIISVKKDILKVPNAALRFRPVEKEKTPGGKKGQAVYIADNDKPKRVSVTAGTSDGTVTEIVSDEIKEGQEVILEALSAKDSKSKASGPPRMF